MDDHEWMDEAACRTAPTSLFFLQDAEERNWQHKEKWLPGRLICPDCPVQKTCLSYAIENRIGYGIWGGFTTKERRALRKRWGTSYASHIQATVASLAGEK